jgi:hypothetical protein
MKSNQIIAVIVLLLVVAIGSFFGGTKYQQNKTFSNFRQQMVGGNNLPQGMGRNAQNIDLTKNRGQIASFRQTIGEIISIDDKTITVKLADGGSKIVLISETTKINQSVAATKTDLVVGTKIMVNGETNTDGSITSRNIEINPAVVTLTATPTVKQ